MELNQKLGMKNAIPEFAVLQQRDLNLLNPIYARLYITVEAIFKFIECYARI